MLPVQPLTRAVHERLPIHFLFRQVEAGDVVGAVVCMWLSRGIDDQDCRESRQHAACDNFVDDVADDAPPE